MDQFHTVEVDQFYGVVDTVDFSTSVRVRTPTLRSTAKDALQLALAMLSYHDVAHKPAEAVYQAFILGLLATLERTHEVTSNREAGHGRYDVLICPRQAGQPGAVLELKVPRAKKGETAEQALASAEAQLRVKDYAAALRERGAGSVAQWAVVFAGKSALVRVVV